MGSKKKIGVRIDEECWKRFKRFVENKHGRTRGVTADEVENALDMLVDAEYPTDRLARIENDVATIKAQLAEADGGEVAIPDPVDDPPAPSNGSCTHTPDGNITSDDTIDAVDDTGEQSADDTSTDDGDDGDDIPKPHEKAPKSKKAEWVFHELDSGDPVVVNPKAVENKVRKSWGFGDRATDDILSIIFDKYHAIPVREDTTDYWQVGLGKTEDDREEAIDERFDGDDYQFVPRDKFDDVTDVID